MGITGRRQSSVSPKGTVYFTKEDTLPQYNRQSLERQPLDKNILVHSGKGRSKPSMSESEVDQPVVRPVRLCRSIRHSPSSSCNEDEGSQSPSDNDSLDSKLLCGGRIAAGLCLMLQNSPEVFLRAQLMHLHRARNALRLLRLRAKLRSLNLQIT